MKANILRPFLPSLDFKLSKSFYKELGFRITYNSSELVIFTLGDVSFFLQNAYQEVWAENTMVQLIVDDLEGFFELASSLISKYPNTKIKPIFKADYGRTFHLLDPAGVLWHFME